MLWVRHLVKYGYYWVSWKYKRVVKYSWRRRNKFPSRFFVKEERDPDAVFVRMRKSKVGRGCLAQGPRFRMQFIKEQTSVWWHQEEARAEKLYEEKLERERIRLARIGLQFRRRFGYFWPKSYPIGLKGKALLEKRIVQGKVWNVIAHSRVEKRFTYWTDRHTLCVLLIPAIIFFAVQWFNEDFLNWGVWVAFFAIIWYWFWQDWLFSASRWFWAWCIWSTFAQIYFWLPFTG
jgi:hypothetical protein